MELARGSARSAHSRKKAAEGRRTPKPGGTSEVLFRAPALWRFGQHDVYVKSLSPRTDFNAALVRMLQEFDLIAK
jgi:hypothetical protein